jgi:exopolysaccharide biosynthesis polyprenyl glycosylphosphotransferase
MKNNATLAYSFLLIVGDFLALLAAFSVAYVLRVKFDTRPLIEQIPAVSYFLAFATVLPLWIIVHGFLGLYNHSVYERRFSELGRLLMGSFVGILVVIGYDFISTDNLFPARLIPVYGFVIGFSFLVLFRSFARLVRQWLYSFGFGVSNVLIIGDTPVTLEIVEAIKNTQKTGQRVLALVSAQATGFKSYATFEEATASLRRGIHSIIQTELYKDTAKNNAILTYAQQNHVAYRFVPGNSDLFVGNIQVELFAGLPMIAVHQTALIGWGRIAKRLFDVIVSTLLLVIFLPVFLLIAVLSKLLYPRGSVFFRQIRLTRFNRGFKVFKFRSQYSKYDGTTPEQAFQQMGKPELAQAYRSNGDFLKKDPRVTPFGRFLRASSLDELPQLINVLKGDISLVGPRALIPEELDTHAKKHTILSVKSGLTGLAQVSGRRDISFDERRQLDMYYVQNWSFGMDISILLKTIRAVLGGVGAK